MPYMDPTNTIVKHYVETSSFDYEALPKLTTLYEKADYVLPDEPYHYKAATAAFTDTMVGEALPDGEQIYEDPGYDKNEIYSWFEEKKFRKLERSDIK